MLFSSLLKYQKRFLFLGIGIIAIVSVARYFGVLQGIEWKVFDLFLRLRPTESIDERITIVEITDADIQTLGTYPVPHSVIVNALGKIQQYQPQSIGLDIFRDFPIYGALAVPGEIIEAPDYLELIETVQANPNIFVIDRLLQPTVAAPPNIPLKQVGFADVILDGDGALRRSLLGNPGPEGDYRFSLTTLLAVHYLEQKGIAWGNDTHDPIAMRFGDTTIASAHSRSRGYVTEDIGPNPVVLINFRSGPTPFQKVSLSDLLAEKVSADQFKDRIVLIGVTARSVKDFVNSAVVSASNPGLVPGVEVQAHAISQILSAVLDGRPILKTWPAIWEYLWIIIWGLIGIGLSRFINSPVLHLSIIALTSASLFWLGYRVLLVGWSLPIIPAVLVCFGNGAVLYSFHWYDQSQKLRIEERQRVITLSYSTIHNGPLQTLAHVLQILDEGDYCPQALRSHLATLNVELRSIYEWMEQSASSSESQLYLKGGFAVDMNEPLHELLYQIYSYTSRRNFPGFSGIRFHITQFEPMAEEALSLRKKQAIAWFFEEALCNVGRHAQTATRLEVTCQQTGKQNIICVADNGIGYQAAASAKLLAHGSVGGQGSRQAAETAKLLGGVFQRRANSPRGTICQLSWPVKPTCWRFWHWRGRIAHVSNCFSEGSQEKGARSQEKGARSQEKEVR